MFTPRQIVTVSTKIPIIPIIEKYQPNNDTSAFKSVTATTVIWMFVICVDTLQFHLICFLSAYSIILRTVDKQVIQASQENVQWLIIVFITIKECYEKSR